MIKVSKFFRLLILLSSIYMLGFLNIILNDTLVLHKSLIQVIVAGIGILIACYVKEKPNKKGNLIQAINAIQPYIRMYTVIIMIEAVSSVVKYHYSVNELLFIMVPYLYVYWAYAILYVLCYEEGKRTVISKICCLVTVILAIKTIGWCLYTFLGITVLKGLLFQYGDWFRDGILRVDVGFLFGITFTYSLFRTIRGEKKHALIVAFLMLYAVMINQSRYLVITLVLTIGIVYCFGEKRSKNSIIRIMLVVLLLIIAIASGALDNVLVSFSSQGQYNKSTFARIETIQHLWSVYQSNNPLLGLGFLHTDSDALIRNTANETLGLYATRYYLSDIGVLGGFFTFGIMAFFMYGGLATLALKTYKKVRSNKNNMYFTLVLGLVSYLFISTIMLNIFDSQRAFDIPFYVAIFGFMNSVCLGDTLKN